LAPELPAQALAPAAATLAIRIPRHQECSRK
jgi:hypothetical protein